MAEKAEDLYLPNAVLLRIIRESLPERTLVSREARSAISKSASSFILYVTSLASVHSEKAKRKTLTGNDILAALKEMEFDHFIPALKEFLDKVDDITEQHDYIHGDSSDDSNDSSLSTEALNENLESFVL
ncbi:DNA polymerase epsilon subunit 3 [Schistosoma japonicum]|nr:DNA polymerase epsilon subunit 3 [Schistosoma japonicum]